MKHWKCLLLCSLLGSASMQAAACYTVYDRSDSVVYQGSSPPVDMSRPIHETLSVRFPGGHMIFDAAASCSDIIVPTRIAAISSVSSPLLTDERTARAMQLPHTLLAGGVALVQSHDVAMAQGITVVPSVAVAAGRPNRQTIITELRDPPITIVESGDGVAVEQRTRAMGAGPSR
jgi:hypothetical protein